MWAAISTISIFPMLIDFLMKFTQAQNRIVFGLIFGVLILYSMVFNLVHRTEKANRDIKKLVQEIAFLRYQIDNNKKNK